MSQQYSDVNRGVLFINDRKSSDKHPDRKGSINIDGKEYWLSGWDRQTSRGDTISLSIEAKKSDNSVPSTNNKSQAASPNFHDDDDLPF